MNAPPEYRIEFAHRAARKLRSLPRELQTRLRPAIDALAGDPRPPGVAKMHDIEHCYRVRHGDYRIVYSIKDECLVVLILSVADRKDAYASNEIAALKKIIKEWHGSSEQR